MKEQKSKFDLITHGSIQHAADMDAPVDLLGMSSGISLLLSPATSRPAWLATQTAAASSLVEQARCAVVASLLEQRLAYFALTRRAAEQLLGRSMNSGDYQRFVAAVSGELAEVMYQSKQGKRTAAGLRLKNPNLLAYLNLDDDELARQQSELHAFCTAPAASQAPQLITPPPMAPPSTVTQPRPAMALLDDTTLEKASRKLVLIDPNADMTPRNFLINLIAGINAGSITASADDVEKYSSRLREIIANDDGDSSLESVLSTMKNGATSTIKSIHAAATRANTTSADDDDDDDYISRLFADECDSDEQQDMSEEEVEDETSDKNG